MVYYLTSLSGTRDSFNRKYFSYSNILNVDITAVQNFSIHLPTFIEKLLWISYYLCIGIYQFKAETLFWVSFSIFYAFTNVIEILLLVSSNIFCQGPCLNLCPSWLCFCSSSLLDNFAPFIHTSFLFSFVSWSFGNLVFKFILNTFFDFILQFLFPIALLSIKFRTSERFLMFSLKMLNVWSSSYMVTSWLCTYKIAWLAYK